MKCQRNASPYSACLASRSCARFSPTTCTPASASAAMSRSETYFVAATTVTPGPTSSWTRASRSRMRSGDGTDHSLNAARKAVAPVREEELRMVPRTEVDPVDPRNPGIAERAFRRAPQVELSVDRQIVAKEPRHLGPHLVATRPDGWTDDSRKSLRRIDAQCLHARGDDALREPAPAGMEHRERARALRPRDRDRKAVGGH